MDKKKRQGSELGWVHCRKMVLGRERGYKIE